MSKLTEFRPTDEATIVTRLLIVVHKAIDESFPQAEPASRRFAKTVFSTADEPTINQVLPQEVLNSDSHLHSGDNGKSFSTRVQNVKTKIRRLNESPKVQIALSIIAVFLVTIALYLIIF